METIHKPSEKITKKTSIETKRKMDNPQSKIKKKNY